MRSERYDEAPGQVASWVTEVNVHPPQGDKPMGKVSTHLIAGPEDAVLILATSSRASNARFPFTKERLIGLTTASLVMNLAEARSLVADLADACDALEAHEALTEGKDDATG